MADNILVDFIRLRRQKLKGMTMAHDCALEIGEDYIPREEDLEIVRLLDDTIQKMTVSWGI